MISTGLPPKIFTGSLMTSKDAERESNEPIRVAIVEDDRATREGLGMLINGTPGYACVGAFRSVEEALQSMSQNVPDVLLLDIQLPGMPGSEGVKAFLAKFPQLEIIMLTVLAE